MQQVCVWICSAQSGVITVPPPSASTAEIAGAVPPDTPPLPERHIPSFPGVRGEGACPAVERHIPSFPGVRGERVCPAVERHIPSFPGVRGEGVCPAVERHIPSFPGMREEGVCPGRECPVKVCLERVAARTSDRTSDSRVRKAVSPYRAKYSGMVQPMRSTMAASRSENGQPSNAERDFPTLLFPQPIKPVRLIIILLE